MTCDGSKSTILIGRLTMVTAGSSRSRVPTDSAARMRLARRSTSVGSMDDVHMRGVPSPAPLGPLGGSPPYRRRGARCALLLVRDDRGDLGTSRPEASSWRRPPTEARDLDHA